MKSKVGICFNLIFLLFTSEAYSCGESPILAPWSLDHKSYSGYDPGHDELPYLSPGNDTRTNLQFLMFDASPWDINNIASALIHKDQSNDYDYDGSSNINLFLPALFTKTDLDSAFCKKNSNKSSSNNQNLNQINQEFNPEGSRCNSSAQGSIDFIKSVSGENKLTAEEKENLISQRKNLRFSCDKQGQPIAEKDLFLNNIKDPSPLAKDFAAYLAGSKSFYDGNFDQALKIFISINESKNSWLSETSIYMTARTLLNKSQDGAFNDIEGTPSPKVSNIEALNLSKKSFNRYLSEYPNGIYANSAKGLMRRIYWLERNYNALSLEYNKIINQIGGEQNYPNSSDIANEIDSKYLNEAIAPRDNIYFIVVESLRRMRNINDGKVNFPEVDLLKFEKYFTEKRKLFLFLLSARAYYVDNDLNKAKNILKSEEFNKNEHKFIDFSRDMLLGQIFLSSNSYQEAEQHFTSLLPTVNMIWMKEAVELGLAMSWERLGTVDRAFDKNNRINSPRIRSILIKYIAGPIILREVIKNPLSLAEEKTLSYYVLLFKEATRGQYRNFIKDINLLNSGNITLTPEREINISDFHWAGSKETYKCSGIIKIMQDLDKNPSNSHSLLCLSEFIRINNLDDFEKLRPEISELGGGKSIFPGIEFSRGEIYKKLIQDNTTPENDKAYALYRAIMCYSPTNMNGCGGVDVAVSQRKNWYNIIKTKYGNMPWAKSLQYYW